MTGVRMADMTRAELNELAPDALLVLPIGATEQHGEHLAVGTDHVVADAVAVRAATALADEFPMVVAPVVPFGHSHHHLPFGGTLSVLPATYQQVLVELGQTAVTSGFRRIFILNGHGGNVEIAATAAREIGRTCDVSVGSGSYWIMAWERLVAASAHRGQRLPGHAGGFETSLMLALRPDAVRDERPRRDPLPDQDGTSFFGPFHAAIPGQWQSIDGWSDDANGSTDDAGERFLTAIVDGVAENLRTFYQRFPPATA